MSRQYQHERVNSTTPTNLHAGYLSVPRSFDPFDSRRRLPPTELDQIERHEIYNIIQSYHGNYDLFGELLQNAVDAVQKRWNKKAKGYEPAIWIYIDLDANSVTALDNGVGMSEGRFKLAFAPQVTDKTADERGSKGVGLSYLAYGFDSILLATKKDSRSLVGSMSGGRDWAEGLVGAQKPLVDCNPSLLRQLPPEFGHIDTGTSVRVKCGTRTRPRNLRVLAGNSPGAWETIMRTRTALGVLNIESLDNLKQFVGHLKARIKLVDNGIESPFRDVTPEYIFPHLVTGISCLDYQAWYARHAPNIHQLQSRDRNKDAIFKFWDTTGTADLYQSAISRTDENDATFERTTPRVYGFYAYSTKVFDIINERIGIPNRSWIQAGLHLASKSMIQCEPLEISLTQRVHEQRVMHIVIEFDRVEPDLGRKSFQKEVVDVAQILGRRVHQYFLDKKDFLKVSRELPTGHEVVLEEWQQNIHERELSPENIVKDQAILTGSTSKEFVQKLLPTEEQEVIVMFTQLCALSILKGYMLLACATTGKPYDSLFRSELQQGSLFPESDRKSRLNIPVALFGPDRVYRTRTSRLEFKHDLRDLISDFAGNEKQFSNVDLVVAWDSSFSDLETYSLEGILEQTTPHRKYFGTTHVLTNSENREHEVEVILLRHLLDFLASN
jgi:hypothetical protein